VKRLRHIIEYLSVLLLFKIVHITPKGLIKVLSKTLGSGLYYLSARRRGIALDNLTKAYKGQLSDHEVRAIAKRSCQSLIQTFLEGAKYHSLFNNPHRVFEVAKESESILRLFKKAKDLHTQYGGCIFVTPHLGNWEFLPHVSAAVGIPLTVVARPLDNPYLERLLYQSRVATGQMLIPKRNALYKLQQALLRKRSIGMLPDQSTMKGLKVWFFGRRATATPIPALLSLRYKKPIVVVACCRDHNTEGFTGFVGDPIMPIEDRNEREEVERLTQEFTNHMEAIIRQYPEQYLWIHNRWKEYPGDKKMQVQLED
jgi:KDO2-lipid IV(A) lauroyltransferase